jgi:hypothetical protein
VTRRRALRRLAFGAVTLLAACAGSFGQELQAPYRASIEAGASPFVRVTNSVGEVRVVPGDTNAVEIAATKYGSTRDELDAISIAAQRSGNDVSIETQYRSAHRGGVRYRITVPRGASLQIDNTVGRIDVGPVGGNVAAESSVGSITLRIASDSSATVTASAALGSISSDFESIQEERSNLVGAQAAGRIGAGTATVHLAVKTGSIAIERE